MYAIHSVETLNQIRLIQLNVTTQAPPITLSYACYYRDVVCLKMSMDNFTKIMKRTKEHIYDSWKTVIRSKYLHGLQTDFVLFLWQLFSYFRKFWFISQLMLFHDLFNGINKTTFYHIFDLCILAITQLVFTL